MTYPPVPLGVLGNRPVSDYVDHAVRHVMMRQGVLGVTVSIMLPHDPTVSHVVLCCFEVVYHQVNVELMRVRSNVELAHYLVKHHLMATHVPAMMTVYLAPTVEGKSK